MTLSSPGPLRIALVDNYDSYSYNLFHLFAAANAAIAPTTFFSDAFQSLDHLITCHGHFDAFILSPGPGNPVNLCDFSPLQRDILSSSYPVFAVCLGHQALCHLYGATIQPLDTAIGPAHGIVSKIRLSPAAFTCPLFANIPSSFSAVRYHSLHANPDTLSTHIIPTAWITDEHIGRLTASSVLMAVRHRTLPHFGVQFHPESICSNFGSKLAYNFIHLATRLRSSSSPSYVRLPRHPPHPLPTSSAPFKTVFTNLGCLNVSPLAVFSSLFAKQKGSFWLDSAVADKYLVPSNPVLQSHSSLPEQHCNNSNARFSIMGNCNGPQSEVITYDVTRNTISVHHAQSNNVTEIEGCVFDYVKHQTQGRRSVIPEGLPCNMNGGYVGYFGYELKRNMEGVRGVGHLSELPDAWLVFADRIVMFDHQRDEILLVALVLNDSHGQDEEKRAYDWFDSMKTKLKALSLTQQRTIVDEKSNENICNTSNGRNGPRLGAKLKFTPDRSRNEYLSDISECLSAIRAGESYEICLTNRLRTMIPEERADGKQYNTLELYTMLRSLNPAPYSAYLSISEDISICCTSPERFLTVDGEGCVESKPIKGTRRRGRTVQEDENLRQELATSSKDRSENLMIVDLVRNDLGRTCTIGSVQVPKLMRVESYASVHQLVSTVTGRLLEDKHAVDCIKGAYPMGSMTGAPKIRTMQIIDELETSARGVYSGSIGYVSCAGAANLNVVIRTAVINKGQLTIGIGGAIVSKSCAQDEYEETVLKGRALMQAIAKYFTGDKDAYVVQHNI